MFHINHKGDGAKWSPAVWKTYTWRHTDCLSAATAYVRTNSSACLLLSCYKSTLFKYWLGPPFDGGNTLIAFVNLRAPKRVLEEKKRGRSRFLYDPANKPFAYWGWRRRRKLNMHYEQIVVIVEQQTKSHKVWSYSSPHPLRKSASSLSLQTYDWVWLLEQKLWWRTRDPLLLFGLMSGSVICRASKFYKYWTFMSHGHNIWNV